MIKQLGSSLRVFFNCSGQTLTRFNSLKTKKVLLPRFYTKLAVL